MVGTEKAPTAITRHALRDAIFYPKC